MSVYTVNLEDGNRHTYFLLGCSMREILDTTDLKVRSGCRRIGACVYLQLMESE